MVLKSPKEFSPFTRRGDTQKINRIPRTHRTLPSFLPNRAGHNKLLPYLT